MSKLKNVNDLIRIGDAIAVLCRKTCRPGAFCPDAYCDEMWDKFDGVERFKAEPERKTGKWRKMHHNPWHECSLCGWESDATYNFCPNCGADMKGEQDGSER